MAVDGALATPDPEISGYRRVLAHLRDLLVNGGVKSGTGFQANANWR